MRMSTVAIVLAVSAGALICACVDEAEPLDANALAGFRVTVVDSSQLGDVPFEFLSVLTPVTIRIEALLADGSTKTDYTGNVQLRVVPGDIDEGTQFAYLQNGVVEAHEVRLRFSFDNTEIWVEEVGVDQFDECVDGFDNDGNGLVDFPGDPGCFGLEDPSEGTASYVTGLSTALEFASVTIRDVQFNPDDLSGESPLIGEEVIVERGNLIATNVTFDGLFVTDIAETEGYNSIFLFNFNFPDGVILGDRLLSLSGGVNEFQSATQLTFPDWVVDPDYNVSDEVRSQFARCEVVNDPNVLEVVPVPLSPVDLTSLETLESLESSVVTISDGQGTNLFMMCDLDESGRVSGTDEEVCRDQCQNNIRCTELSSFLARDQFSVAARGTRVYVAGAKRIANFDALAHCELIEGDFETYQCPDWSFPTITGNLRHIFLTTRIQLWVLYPRFACDLQITCSTSDLCPPGTSCTENLCQ